VPLEKIFFLRPAKRNTTTKLAGTEAVSMLLTHCLLPYWDSKGMQFVLDFCENVVQKKSCYDLGFIPKKNVVEFIRSTK
jgi:hypothetical protein